MPRFGPWLPDQYLLNTRAAGEAKGVLPGPSSYLPWPQLVAFSQALATACRGAFLARKTDGSYTVFVGTATKLYKYVGPADAWTDVTRSSGGDYDVPNDERWSFAQFTNETGNILVACNANTAPQYIDIEAGTNFAALGGSPPSARYVKTVGSQLFLGGLVDNPNRVAWSGRNNAAFWTFGSRDSDYQDFQDGGHVTGLTNLETGLIFQEGAIRRFVPTNDRAIYNFGRVEDARGLIAPDSLVVLGRRAFSLSSDGFYATDGTGASRPIGADAVDEWFQKAVNFDRLYSICGTADPVRQRIFWLFPSVGNTSDVLDNCLCFDIQLNQWTHAEFDASFIFNAVTPAYTTDSIDVLLTALGYTIETAPFSFDARFLQGGAPYLSAFDADFKMSLFSGTPMAATVETADFQAIPNRRSFVRGIWPQTDATGVTVQVAAKERPQSALTYGASSSVDSKGFCPVRSSGRIHRVRASVAAGATWSHLQGVEIDAVQDGER